MLKEKFSKYLNAHKFYRNITILGMSVVIFSGLSLFNQINRTNIYSFVNSDSNGISLDAIQKTTSLEVTETIEVDIDTEIKRQKASLLSVIYTEKPLVDENFGTLIIDKLKRDLPIIQGTNDEQLSKGVGHIESSVLPGENDNSVFAGHRETDFRGLDKLVTGDLINISTEIGEFIYEVDLTRIVKADDTTVIVSTGYSTLTLITCYPFDWIGSAPQRYIITAILIKRVLNP